MPTPENPESVKTIRSRFVGDSGFKLLVRTVSENSLLRGNLDIAEIFCKEAELQELNPGDVLVEQDGSDNELYLIISGNLNVIVNGRIMAQRYAGSFVGEVALADPAARRSASLIADNHVLVMKISEHHFSSAADKHSELWRRIAVETARRLVERNRFVSPPRNQPVIFLGCSREALSIAREIQTGLAHDPFVVTLWTDGVFHASHTPIEDLVKVIKEVDFGVLILTPDDMLFSVHGSRLGPRDNVLFELGLLIGAIGRERTFILSERNRDLKIPTDLTGVKPIEFSPGQPETLPSRLGPACSEIRKIVTKIGPK